MKSSWVLQWTAFDDQTQCDAKCSFDPSRFIYRVTVSRGEKSLWDEFPATFEPVDGMEEADLQRSGRLAVLLADSMDP